MNEHKKPSIIGPGASGIVMVFFLLIFSKENTQEKLSEIQGIFGTFALFIFSVSAIWIWQKYLKEYVAFAIEQKLREINKRPED